MEGIINEIKLLFKKNGLDCTGENARTVLSIILRDSRISKKAILLSAKKFYNLEKD